MASFPLSGSAELAARINSFAWSGTALGPIDSWPQSLKIALGILLGSRFPMQILWGPDYLHFYNDAYLPIAADKHPRALGKPGSMVWPEIWGDVLPILEQVRASGEPSWASDQLLMLERNSAVEEGYFTFSYSPIRGESGAIEGVFIAVTETTGRVLAERRLRSIRDLAAQITGLADEGAVLRAGAATLAQNPADIPCALCYLLDEGRQGFRLAWSIGLPDGHPAAPPLIPLAADADGSAWPLAGLKGSTAPFALAQELEVLPPLVAGRGAAPVRAAALLPMRDGQADELIGCLIVGLSPRLPFDGEYAEFLERISNHLTAAIVGARNQALASLAVRVRDDFLSIAAHELKTPLTPMIARLQLMARRFAHDGLGQRHQDDLALVTTEALRLASLIDVLLDISRLRSGQLSIERAAVDVAQVVARCAAEIEPSLTNHTLALSLPAGPALLDGDAMRLKQMLRNLLSNAVKYSPNGGEIGVRLSRGRRAITLVVRDEGMGIAADVLPMIFERYYRVGGAASARIGGLGIGLFVVHEIVRLHGGSISVESAPGAGAAFTVVLPIADGSLTPVAGGGG